MLKGRQRVGGFAGLGNSNNQGTRVRHAIAVAVFTGNFYIDGNLGNGLYPVTRRQAGVAAGAASQDQDVVDFLENLVGAVAEQFRRDSFEIGSASSRERVCQSVEIP